MLVYIQGVHTARSMRRRNGSHSHEGMNGGHGLICAVRATLPPPPTIPYTFLDPLGPLVGAASGTTTAEAQRSHAARIRRLRAGWCVEISASAAPEGVPSQT